MRSCLTIRWLALLAVVAMVETACGPIRATTGMTDARLAIQDAEVEGADAVALYEMTLAREYLGKAREELGYNDYYMAEQLAIKAAELADLALEKTIGSAVFKAGEEEVPVVAPNMEELPDWGEVSPDWGKTEDERKGTPEEGDILDTEEAWDGYTPSTDDKDDETSGGGTQ